VKVRAATLDDVPELARVHTESSAVAYDGIAPPDPDGLVRRMRNWNAVIRKPDFHGFLAEDDGVAVGVLSVGASEHEDGAGELYAIYVHPDYWGRGAGQMLLDQAHQTLSELFDEAILTVLVANPRARRFYERNGWTLYDIRTEMHFGGIPIEVAKYRRRLVSDTQGA
jgi:ribosomal protein S18 acetylase RimI-like enzyme